MSCRLVDGSPARPTAGPAVCQVCGADVRPMGGTPSPAGDPGRRTAGKQKARPARGGLARLRIGEEAKLCLSQGRISGMRRLSGEYGGSRTRRAPVGARSDVPLRPSRRVCTSPCGPGEPTATEQCARLRRLPPAAACATPDGESLRRRPPGRSAPSASAAVASRRGGGTGLLFPTATTGAASRRPKAVRHRRAPPRWPPATAAGGGGRRRPTTAVARGAAAAAATRRGGKRTRRSGAYPDGSGHPQGRRPEGRGSAEWTGTATTTFG